MKKTILVCLTCISLSTYGQNATTSTLKTGNRKDLFTCQHIELTPDNVKVFLKENVKIETENLFLKADSAEFDNANQTLVAYGIKEFTFNGGETITTISGKAKNTIRYKLKDKKIYIE